MKVYSVPSLIHHYNSTCYGLFSASDCVELLGAFDINRPRYRLLEQMTS